MDGRPEDCIKATAGDYHTQFWSTVPEWEWYREGTGWPGYSLVPPIFSLLPLG